MEFSEKLMDLRRREGLSQEQLADRLGVTRQSVSKWESGSAMPELGKLIAIADLFGVTLDELVRGRAAEPEQKAEDAGLKQRLETLEGAYQENFGPYFAYTSKTKLFGLPLVSIRFGRERHPSKRTTAVGIIAIGNFSVGVVSIGLISLGVLSVGMVAFGGLVLGMVALGGISLGISAGGFVARGIAAVNLLK